MKRNNTTKPEPQLTMQELDAIRAPESWVEDARRIAHAPGPGPAGAQGTRAPVFRIATVCCAAAVLVGSLALAQVYLSPDEPGTFEGNATTGRTQTSAPPDDSTLKGVGLNTVFPPVKGSDVLDVYENGGRGEGGAGEDFYQVENKVIADTFVLPKIDWLTLYRYEQLPAAEELKNLVAEKFGIVFGPDNTLDSTNMPDYVAYYGLTKDDASAELQYNIKTGLFHFTQWQSDSAAAGYVKAYNGIDLGAVKELCREKARLCAELFEAITGPLQLKEEKDDRFSLINVEDHIYEGGCYTFVFVPKQAQKLLMQENPPVYADRVNGEFAVTIRPDGMILSIDNGLTTAAVTAVKEKQMFTMEQLEQFINGSLMEEYSEHEHDTIVYVRCAGLVYNQDTVITELMPQIEVEYYFESNPAEILTTTLVPDWVRDPEKLE